MDANLLRYHVKKNGDSNGDLATAIGIAESTLYRKMRGEDAEFTQGEIKTIVARYELTPDETKKIFF